MLLLLIVSSLESETSTDENIQTTAEDSKITNILYSDNKYDFAIEKQHNNLEYNLSEIKESSEFATLERTTLPTSEDQESEESIEQNSSLLHIKQKSLVDIVQEASSNTDLESITASVNETPEEIRDKIKAKRNAQKIRDQLEFEDMEAFDPDFHRRPKINCTAPNTVPGYRDCQCQREYFGDNPLQERGCWICTPKCHTNAKCSYPGICKCRDGLVGDGVDNCSSPFPTLKSFYVAPGFVIAEYYVNTSELFLPYISFCKLFDQRIIGKNFNNNSILCLTPPHTNGKTKLSISFDGKSFSNELEITTIEQPPPENRVLRIHNPIIPKQSPFVDALKSLTVVFASIAISYFALTRKTIKEKESDEIPFLRPVIKNDEDTSDENNPRKRTILA